MLRELQVLAQSCAGTGQGTEECPADAGPRLHQLACVPQAFGSEAPAFCVTSELHPLSKSCITT